MTHITLGQGIEFDRIRQIAAALGDSAGELGDDTAAVPIADGTLVVSTDMSVEGEHFMRAWLTPEEIGWRATASALSDLAAAAARPAGITVAVGVPHDSQPDDLIAVMRGVGQCSRTVGARVLGGDISRANQWTLSVTVLGHAKHVMSRKGARPGDGVWVTGALGGARAALVAWQRGEMPHPLARESFVHPQPRIVVAEWLAAHGATAMLDISDGLGGDVQHLAAASACRVELALETVPIHDAVPEMARLIDESPAVFAATGGEDYELLLTIPGEWDMAKECLGQTGVAVTRIGNVIEGSDCEFRLQGKSVGIASFRHQV